jgi:hypothetical protein
MGKRKDDTSYDGPKRVVRSEKTICGWCIDGFCEDCKPEFTFYDRIYVCGCKCQDDYVVKETQDEQQ